MPRKREIRPQFALDEDLGGCSPVARLFAIYLLMWVDREGFVEDRPKRLKAEMLPYDDADGTVIVDELVRKTRYLKRVELCGVKLLSIVNFKKYQGNIHPNEVPSRFLATTKDPPRTHQGPTKDVGCKASSSSSSSSSFEEVPNGTCRAKPRRSVPYSQIVTLLNDVCDRQFKTDPVPEPTKRLIKARFNGGATVEDFESVIRVKADQWLTDERMAQFLRPSTLFQASKFDEYLAEARDQGRAGGSSWMDKYAQGDSNADDQPL